MERKLFAISVKNLLIHLKFHLINFFKSNANPNLSEAPSAATASVVTLRQNVLDGLRAVANDLKETSDADKDNLERMATVAHTMSMLSLDDLRSLWQDVKSEDCTFV